MMEHTKGDWSCRCIGVHTYQLPNLPKTAFPEELRANERLIETSPDLLNICKEMVDAVNGSTAQVMATAGRMNAIIAKAEGLTEPAGKKEVR
jgi:hypothetical protein